MTKTAIEIQENLKKQLLNFLGLLDGIYLQCFAPKTDVLVKSLRLGEIPLLQQNPMEYISLLYSHKIHQHIAGICALARSEKNCLAPLVVNARVVIEARVNLSFYLSYGRINGPEELLRLIIKETALKVKFLSKTEGPQGWSQLLTELKEKGIEDSGKEMPLRSRINEVNPGLVSSYDISSYFIHPHYVRLVWPEIYGGILPFPDKIMQSVNLFLENIGCCYYDALVEAVEFVCKGSIADAALIDARDKRKHLDKLLDKTYPSNQ